MQVVGTFTRSQVEQHLEVRFGWLLVRRSGSGKDLPWMVTGVELAERRLARVGRGWASLRSKSRMALKPRGTV